MSEELVPLDGLKRFLDERFGADDDGITLERLGDGHSNLTFIVRRGTDEWVLRRPPRGEILPGTHEMHREFVVMDAIARNGMPVPVPVPIELCRDESYIGSPFYLMSYVEGVVVRGPMPPHLASDARTTGFELADKLAAIHRIDWQAFGLEELARKPDEFLTRNLGRMQQIYDAVHHREVKEIDEVGEWLRANTPEQRYTTLTHGDYKLDNVMYSVDAPEIVAVVDWEISTIGDPLVDLGWMLYFSPEPGEQSFASVASDEAHEGYPNRAELAQRYAEQTGFAADDLRFYVAMAGWKIAIIMEGSNLRFKQGMADDSMFSALDAAVPALAQRSLQVIEGDIAVA